MNYQLNNVYMTIAISTIVIACGEINRNTSDNDPIVMIGDQDDIVNDQNDVMAEDLCEITDGICTIYGCSGYEDQDCITDSCEEFSSLVDSICDDIECYTKLVGYNRQGSQYYIENQKSCAFISESCSELLSSYGTCGDDEQCFDAHYARATDAARAKFDYSINTLNNIAQIEDTFKTISNENLYENMVSYILDNSCWHDCNPSERLEPGTSECEPLSGFTVNNKVTDLSFAAVIDCSLDDGLFGGEPEFKQFIYVDGGFIAESDEETCESSCIDNVCWDGPQVETSVANRYNVDIREIDTDLGQDDNVLDLYISLMQTFHFFANAIIAYGHTDGEALLVYTESNELLHIFYDQ